MDVSLEVGVEWLVIAGHLVLFFRVVRIAGGGFGCGGVYDGVVAVV